MLLRNHERRRSFFHRKEHRLLIIVTENGGDWEQIIDQKGSLKRDEKFTIQVIITPLDKILKNNQKL